MRTAIILCVISIGTVSAALAHPPWGIVLDENRNIYFADITHNGMGSVWKLTASGELTLLIGDFHAHNVSLDQEGNLITAHGEVPHTLVRITPEGDIDTLYFTPDYQEFFGGNCTWSQHHGKVIYGLREHKYLRELATDGSQRNIGDYQFQWNQAVYAAPDGTIYATEIGTGNGCIVKIDPTGVSTFIARDLITPLNRPKDPHNDILLGMTVGPKGHLYVAETAGRRVVRILEDQRHETFYHSDPDWMPTAIDFFASDAYVLEFGERRGRKGPRIVRVDERGNRSVIFDYDTYEKGEAPPGSIRNPPRNFLLMGLMALALLGAILAWVNTGKYRQPGK